MKENLCVQHVLGVDSTDGWACRKRCLFSLFEVLILTGAAAIAATAFSTIAGLFGWFG